jgi:hypothetical protein
MKKGTKKKQQQDGEKQQTTDMKKHQRSLKSPLSTLDKTGKKVRIQRHIEELAGDIQKKKKILGRFLPANPRRRITLWKAYQREKAKAEKRYNENIISDILSGIEEKNVKRI